MTNVYHLCFLCSQYFGVWGLEKYNDGGSVGSCPSIPFNADSITSQVTNRLECIFKSFEGPSEDLWSDAWKSHGACLGVSIDQYFRLITDGELEIEWWFQLLKFDDQYIF